MTKRQPYKYEAVKVADGTWAVADVNGRADTLSLDEGTDIAAQAVVDALKAEYNRGLKTGAEEAYSDGLDDGRLEACGEEPNGPTNPAAWSDG